MKHGRHIAYRYSKKNREGIDISVAKYLTSPFVQKSVVWNPNIAV